MSVYVDSPIYKYGRMIMCHMVATTEAELHAMADRIGVARRWYQSNARYPHYDICKAKRALAVKYGALEVSSKELVKIAREAAACPPLSPTIQEALEPSAVALIGVVGDGV